MMRKLVWLSSVIALFSFVLGGSTLALGKAKDDSLSALYRSNQPEVLSPETLSRSDQKIGPDVNQALARFESEYGKAGSPKIAVFFNRRISSAPSSWASLARGVSSGSKEISADDPITIVRDSGGNSGKTTAKFKNIKSTTRVESRIEVNLGRSGKNWTHLSDLNAERIQSGFEAALIERRVSLVDRAMIIRLQSANSQSDDLQKLEIDSLSGRSELVVLVNGIYDPGSPLSLAWRVVVLTVDHGEILLSELMRGDALRREHTKEWEAVSGGFVKKASGKDDPDVVGRLMAQRVMNKLVGLIK